MTITYRKFTINGLLMNVALAGEDNHGPWILMIHGFPDDHSVWRYQIPALVNQGFRVIAPDMRGCGDSEIPAERSHYRLDALIDDLVQLMNQLAIPSVRLVGHDWGAVISWHFAIRHPQRVERYAALSVGHPNCYMHCGLEQKLKGWYILFIQLRGIAAFLMQLGDFFLLKRLMNFAVEWPHVRARLSRPGRLMAGLNYYIANMGTLLAHTGNVALPVLGIWSDGDGYLIERQMTKSKEYVTGQWSYEKSDQRQPCGCNWTSRKK
jgi:pimeloyl-ACP methyl ester carboxylesterase